MLSLYAPTEFQSAKPPLGPRGSLPWALFRRARSQRRWATSAKTPFPSCTTMHKTFIRVVFCGPTDVAFCRGTNLQHNDVLEHVCLFVSGRLQLKQTLRTELAIQTLRHRDQTFQSNAIHSCKERTLHSKATPSIHAFIICAARSMHLLFASIPFAMHSFPHSVCRVCACMHACLYMHDTMHTQTIDKDTLST